MKGTLTPTHRVRVPFMSLGIEARCPTIANAGGDLADLLHDLVTDIKVGVDVLDVIGVF
jgi:hypothetical protein